jgi:hypothetical protein
VSFYGALVVAAEYSVRRGSYDLLSFDTYLPALKLCVEMHPFLSTAIRGHETNNPVFIRPASLDLKEHICIVRRNDIKSEEQLLKHVILDCHDAPFEHLDLHPPWRIAVAALSTQDPDWERCLIIFAYSHSHGDGRSGLLFQRTFLDGLNQDNVSPITSIIQTSPKPLPTPLDDNLRISWGYLLGPLFGHYLPAFIPKLLGMPTAITPVTRTTWTGAPMFHDPKTFRTCMEIISIDGETLHNALIVCRRHNAKLTAFMHQAILAALRKHLPEKDFVSQTPIDLRKFMPGMQDNEMGSFASTTFNLHKAHPTTIAPHEEYNSLMHAAAQMTAQLARGVTASNQPVGLLRYIRNMRSWTLGQLGKDRDTSYELSNIMSFDSTTAESNDNTWRVKRVIFSQPANVVGSPISFSAASVRGGELVITASWQPGALGVEGEETNFMKGLCKDIESCFRRLSREEP